MMDRRDFLKKAGVAAVAATVSHPAQSAATDLGTPEPVEMLEPWAMPGAPPITKGVIWTKPKGRLHADGDGRNNTRAR